MASGSVAPCCNILMLVSYKIAGFGGPDGGRLVWVCATTMRCASLSLHFPLVNIFHSTWISTIIIVHRLSVVCFDGSGTRIVVLIHDCSALWAVASGSVAPCCNISMLVTYKIAGFGGPDGGRLVWVCANQNSGFWGVNPWTILKGLSSLWFTHVRGNFTFT